MSEGELLQIEKARKLDITEDIYFTMQYNQFNVLDKTNTYDEFSLGRLIFMFNMNL